MIDAGKDKYPFLPVRLLLKDKYQSDLKIKNVPVKPWTIIEENR